MSHLIQILLILIATMGLSYGYHCSPSHSKPVTIEVEGNEKLTIEDDGNTVNIKIEEQ
ncbi:MAG: hypothetical protein P8L77_04635 [Gammaproteobacteria bacterium]|nr:hypothetical protein [Gammaproteobacteria bacterium]